ncbi:diaminopropionate ammonia-lyase [Clostridiaceae bacterium HSG29]|nr:diaminopropionate ammonia-lyase [Clostridiaceae bacterium HSG29]
MQKNKSKHCEYISAEKKSSKMECDFLTAKSAEKVYDFVSTSDDYSCTPLVALDSLADRYGVKKIYVKDESKRMGLNAFKGVGVFYGVARIICEKLGLDISETSFSDFMKPEINEKLRKLTFIAATDGNHGNGLAYVTKMIGCKCVIYMPKNTTKPRVDLIREKGAEVFVTEYNYDDTLRLVIDKAAESGWVHFQDQAWEGYKEITNLISEGYTIIAHECMKQMNEDGVSQPTHIILQAGAGTFAFGILGYFVNVLSDSKPQMIISEPKNANCYYQSAIKKEYINVTGELETIMAGLAVGEANIAAYDYLYNWVDGYASCDDVVSARGMRILANPIGDDKKVVSGESGALGFGLLSMICDHEDYSDIKEKCNIDENSIVLLISTEGNTDPEMYEKIVWNGAYNII